jgi:proteic killer suppression protein
VIASFACKETERLWHRGFSRRLDHAMQAVALRKLRMLHNAQRLGDLTAFPGSRLEALKGNRSGQWSIRINDQWRICFRWQGNDAHQVEIVDYH